MIEAVMASAILALVTGGIVSLLNITIRSGASVENRIQAYQLMQGAFEQARNVRDTTWIDGTPNAWDLKLPTETTTPTVSVGSKQFIVERSITALNANKKKIDVTVKDKTGKQILTGSTILTNWIKP